ncbi:MAG: insulinase family protein [Pyrinomonadaceae bacterium]|nr:insulinase family protein [Pyrinomonadaceae bacterium]
MLKRPIVLTLVILLLAGICFAQPGKFPKPREEKLLNDLKMLIWSQPTAEKVLVSLRVHSGAAFDPVNKEGTSKLLTEIMFPNTGIFEDFEEDLGGSLKVRSTLDYMQFDMTASPDKLVSVLEILAGAIINTQIDRETAGIVKKSRIEDLNKAYSDPGFLADRAIAERLYGEFPYGRSPVGTLESLEIVDFADMIFAKQRFLTADNATLIVSGKVSSSFAYRAARRLLGGWQKGDGRVPPNFTLPESPETAPLLVNTDFGMNVERRFAVEAASRRDPVYFAARVLEKVLDARVRGQNGGSVVLNSHFLRGYLVLGETLPWRSGNAPPPLKGDASKEVVKTSFQRLLEQPVTETEFAASKQQVVDEFESKSIIEHWFDVETYRLKSASAEFEKLKAVTLKDVNDFAKKISVKPIVRVDVVPLEAPARLNDGDPDDPR